MYAWNEVMQNDGDQSKLLDWRNMQKHILTSICNVL